MMAFMNRGFKKITFINDKLARKLSKHREKNKHNLIDDERENYPDQEVP